SSGVHSRSPITPRRLAAAPEPGNRRFPPVFSSPAAPGWDKGRFGFYTGLRTPQLPATHAEAETGQCALARDRAPGISRASNGASHLNSCTLTSHVITGRLQ